MVMQAPLHPGVFITDVYLEPNGVTGRELAATLGVTASTVCRMLQGSSRVTPKMALRLSKAIGNTPESWLALQSQHDLWVARKRIDLRRVGRLALAA